MKRLFKRENKSFKFIETEIVSEDDIDNKSFIIKNTTPTDKIYYSDKHISELKFDKL